MSQKQAISQTPIDLKPEDEARAKAKSGAPSPEAAPTPHSGEAQAVPNRDQQQQQPKPGRPQAPRRIQESGDNTVQISLSLIHI